MNDDANMPPPREGIDIPFGPPPEEYLYRCPVCGEEALVNEEIFDVTIYAKFDEDVIEYFQSFGRGYQARMNAVLRAYMEAHRKDHS